MMNIKTINQTNNIKATATVAALTSTIGLATLSWIISIRQMKGMEMGIETPIGSFTSFILIWILMMAAMMLPGAASATVRKARRGGRIGDVLLFIVSYLSVWALFGLPVYALYRPHGTLVAGLITIAAALYEFTPLKKSFRRRCQNNQSGFEFGLSCVGSSLGLMVMQVTLGFMSISWMLVTAALIFAQKLMPVRAIIDV